MGDILTDTDKYRLYSTLFEHGINIGDEVIPKDLYAKLEPILSHKGFENYQGFLLRERYIIEDFKLTKNGFRLMTEYIQDIDKEKAIIKVQHEKLLDDAEISKFTREEFPKTKARSKVALVLSILAGVVSLVLLVIEIWRFSKGH
ncbi:MAG: hypothetical protein ACJASQ_002710 [Crocinitomicaceae bacterium]|jgi:hypothetical protein